MKPLDKGMLVRGALVVGNAISRGVVSKDNEECIVAYTHWYRHDSDLKELERDLANLKAVYSSMKKTGSFMSSYQYKEYK